MPTPDRWCRASCMWSWAATTCATFNRSSPFDVDQTKVGTDLGKAIHAGLNNTVRFAEVGELGVTVQAGPTFDGLGLYYRELIEESPAEPVDVAAALREAGADVLRLLPAGRLRGGPAPLRAGLPRFRRGLS